MLLQIIKIKYKITSISMNAPLSQFFTGLQLLLTSCQEWEEIAHRGVSIQSDGILSSVGESWDYLIKRFSSRTVSRIRNETTNKWLHLVGVVMVSASRRRKWSGQDSVPRSWKIGRLSVQAGYSEVCWCSLGTCWSQETFHLRTYFS